MTHDEFHCAVSDFLHSFEEEWGSALRWEVLKCELSKRNKSVMSWMFPTQVVHGVVTAGTRRICF